MQAVVINHVLQKSCTSDSFFTAECRVLFCCVSKGKAGSFSMLLPNLHSDSQELRSWIARILLSVCLSLEFRSKLSVEVV